MFMFVRKNQCKACSFVSLTDHRFEVIHSSEQTTKFPLGLVPSNNSLDWVTFLLGTSHLALAADPREGRFSLIQ